MYNYMIQLPNVKHRMLYILYYYTVSPCSCDMSTIVLCTLIYVYFDLATTQAYSHSSL